MILGFDDLSIKCCKDANCRSKTVQMKGHCKHCEEMCFSCKYYPFASIPNGTPKERFTYCRKCGKELDKTIDIGYCNKCMTFQKKKLTSKKEKDEDNLENNKKIIIPEKNESSPPVEPKKPIITNEISHLYKLSDLEKINFNITVGNFKYPGIKMIDGFWKLWKLYKSDIRKMGIFPTQDHKSHTSYIMKSPEPLKEKKPKKEEDKAQKKLGAFFK